MNPDDRQNIQPKIRNHKNISLHDIDEMFNSYNENWENYNAIVIGGVLWQGIKFMI